MSERAPKQARRTVRIDLVGTTPAVLRVVATVYRRSIEIERMRFARSRRGHAWCLMTLRGDEDRLAVCVQRLRSLIDVEALEERPAGLSLARSVRPLGQQRPTSHAFPFVG